VALERPDVTLIDDVLLGLGLYHSFCSFRRRIKFLESLVELVSVGLATILILGLLIRFSSDFLVCRRHLCQKDRSLIAFAVCFNFFFKFELASSLLLFRDQNLSS